MTKVKGNQVGSATLDMITGPWLIHQLTQSSGLVTTHIYYLDGVPSQNDFKFLIDGILHYNLLKDTGPVVIRVIESDEEVAASFIAAKNAYIEEYHGVTDDSLAGFKKRMERIKYESVSKVTPSFFELELAIDHG